MVIIILIVHIMKCLIRVVQLSMGSCKSFYAFRTGTTRPKISRLFFKYVC